jgi:hypothetical protein
MPDPREMSQPKSLTEERKGAVNIVHTFAVWHTLCVTPILRSRHGTRAFGGYPAAFIMMLVYAEYTRAYLMVYYYIPAWMIMVVFRRITADREQDSYYRGYPWCFGWMANEYVARLAECFVCFFAFVFTSQVSMPLAKFFLVEIVSLVIVLAAEDIVLRKRKADIADAQRRAARMNDLARGKSGW